MNFRTQIAGILIGLLIACSDSKPNATVPSTPQQQQTNKSKPEVNHPSETGVTKSTNPFNSDSFPKAYCGDQLPDNSKTNTVKLHRVFIDYSESSLKTVKANFCQDAFKTIIKDNGKNIIQVASFKDKQRGNQFKYFLANKLGDVNVEVGEPTNNQRLNSTETAAKAAQSTGDEQNSKFGSLVGVKSSAYEIGKAAKLTPAQVKELIAMEKRKAYKGFRSKEEVKAKFVLPTYVPTEFQVKHFRTRYREKLGGRYEIIYCNSSEYCFLIGGGISLPIGDVPQTYERIENISSPALGKVKLGYTTNYGRKNEPHIGFIGSLDRFSIASRDYEDYIFSSNVGLVGSTIGFSEGQRLSFNKTINFKKAIKIVESLQYLNP